MFTQNYSKVLSFVLCCCLMLMGMITNGGSIPVKLNTLSLNKNITKAEKTVNSDDDPYNYVVHNSGDPAPDELNYFIKGTDADWMADFLQNHNDLAYYLMLDKDNNPIAVLYSSLNKNQANIKSVHNPVDAVPCDILFKNKNVKNANWSGDGPLVFVIAGSLGLGGFATYRMMNEDIALFNFTTGIGSSVGLAISLALIIAGVFWGIFHDGYSNEDYKGTNLTYYKNLRNTLSDWIDVQGLNTAIPQEQKTNYESCSNAFIYPGASIKLIHSYNSNDNSGISEFFRTVNGNSSNIYMGPWTAVTIKKPITANREIVVNLDKKDDVTFSSYTPVKKDDPKESVANSYGLIGSNINIDTKAFDDPDQGSILTKEYSINLGSMQSQGLRSAPSDSYFMFGFDNQASSDLPYNVHFVSTTDDINGGYFILPQSSEMNWNTSDDHIPVPNVNIYTPNDYTFENIADNENVTPYYEKGKNPGYDYMQITQSGKYCVFPIGFTGKDNSSSSTLEVWISPKNGTAEDSYIHVGNIKAQYSSSDSQWHFTYTPVSTPSGWNVTAEKSDITGTSKEDMLSGTQLDNFGLSIVQENSQKMAIQ